MDTILEDNWVEKAFELEKTIEKRWIERLDRVRTDMRDHYSKENAFLLAHKKISEAFISALHNKKVVVPSLHFNSNTADILDQPNDETVLEIVNMAVTYASMGRDFEILLQAIKDNPMLNDEWERFMVLLRMVE